jgi:hypothetical protein
MTTPWPRRSNSLFKAELVRNKGPWKSIDDLEIAVADGAPPTKWGNIDWFNHRRLHGEIGLVPPAEHEDDFYRYKDRGDYRRRVSSEPPLNPARDSIGCRWPACACGCPPSSGRRCRSAAARAAGRASLMCAVSEVSTRPSHPPPRSLMTWARHT